MDAKSEILETEGGSITMIVLGWTSVLPGDAPATRRRTMNGIPKGARRIAKLRHPQFLVTVEGMKPRQAREAIEAALEKLELPLKVKAVTAASVRKLADQWS